MSARRVSFAAELRVLADAVDGAQLLAELLASASLPDEEAVESAPRMLSAQLAVLSARVRLLQQAVVEDAELPVTRSNRSLPHERRALIGRRRR